MNNITKYKLTKESNERVKENIIILDKDIKKYQLFKPNLRIYKSPVNKNNSKNAIISMLIFDENYMASVLTLAMSLRLYKTTSKLVCLVQDKSYINIHNGKKLLGVSQDIINDLLLIFDEVIGIDLLCVNNYVIPTDHFTNFPTYENIYYYCTKLVVLGLTQYDKIIYIDASTIVQKNIDYIFNKFNKSAFQYDNEWEYGNVGLRGTYFIIIPNIYQYNKGLLFLKNYRKYFQDSYFMRGIDEIIIYYSVYPNWSTELLSDDFGCNGNSIRKFKDNCDIYYFQKNKPFRPLIDVSDYDKKNLYDNYKMWDTVVIIVIEKYPQFKKYFSNIKKFRKTGF
jgi:hypothetical protein